MSLIRKITKCIELAKCPRKKRCQAYPMGEYASAANIYTKNCLCPTMQCTIGWMDLATSGRIKRKFQLGQTRVSNGTGQCNFSGQRDRQNFFVPGQRDNGTELPSLSRDKGTTGQAKNLAKGWGQNL